MPGDDGLRTGAASTRGASPAAPTVLVVGATGHAGGSLLRTIRTRTQLAVRAMTRTPESRAARLLRAEGIDVVRADVNDLDSLRNAMAGCYAVATCIDVAATAHHNGDPWLPVRTLLDAAADAGVGHIAVTLAGCTADAAAASGDDPSSPAAGPTRSAEDPSSPVGASACSDIPAAPWSYAQSLGVALDVICKAGAGGEHAAGMVAAVLERRMTALLRGSVSQRTGGCATATSPPSTTNS